jgi:hypothetical protein
MDKFTKDPIEEITSDQDRQDTLYLIAENAIGLGGWKVDPADPFKAPYTPRNAAGAAGRLYSIKYGQPFEYRDGELDAIVTMVQEAKDADPNNPDDYC